MDMFDAKFAVFCAGASILAFAVAGPAVAQDEPVQEESAQEERDNAQPARRGPGIGDIIVTATRREERLQDVPAAVTAVTGDALAGAGLSTVRELTQVIPGFIGSRNMGVFQPVVRGVGSTGISIGDEPNIATYIDGVYQPESGANWIDLVEVERVEVLRGPQGTTFGRNATGGLINVITPDPSFSFRGKASLRVGRMRESAGDYDARLYVTGPVSDGAAVDLAALFRRNDGYLTDLVRGGALGDQRVIDLRSKLLVQLADNVEVVFTGEFFDQESTTNSPQPLDGNTIGRRFPGVIVPTEPWHVSLTEIPTLDLTRWNAAMHLRADLGTVNLEATSGFMNLRWYQETDSDASNLPLGNFPAFFAVESGSQEIKLSSAMPGRFQWLVGGYFYQFGGRSELIPQRAATPNDPLLGPLIEPELSGRSFAGFAEGTYEIANGFYVTLGGRWTTEKRWFTQVVQGRVFVDDASASSDNFDYKIGLRYQITPETNIYATYSTAFKSGVFNMAGISDQPVRPEDIKAIEGGVKSDPLDWLRLNLAVYYYDYTDLQLQARDTDSPNYILQNAANAEIYGGELETIISPDPSLRLRGALAYTHARYKDFPGAQGFIPQPNGGNLVVPVDASGNVMTRAPEWSGSIGVDYERELGRGYLGLNANVSWSTKIFYDYLNNFVQPSYALVNGSISWMPESENWSVSLWATNITNEAVLQTVRPGAFSTDGFYEQPRRIGASFEVQF